MTHLAHTDLVLIEAQARALRAAYVRSLAVALVARLRRARPAEAAHA